MTKQKFFLQGLLLTGVSLFLRVTNMGYRSYLSGQLGAAGMGLYQLIFSIFALTVTLSTSGISLAVTRMVSAAIASGRPQRIRSVAARCLLFCLTISLSIALLLFFLADPAAALFLGEPQAAPCLRVLGLGLPFMSLCTCMKGYFLAVDESLSTAWSDALEQVLTIAATVFFFLRFAPQSMEAACLGAMAASTLGEAASFLSSWAAFRRSLGRNTPARREKSPGVLQGLAHIALPCTLSSAARSLLNTGENLLIPRELQRYGLPRGEALSQYGLLQGMAMPMLYFPSSFLSSFAPAHSQSGQGAGTDPPESRGPHRRQSRGLDPALLLLFRRGLFPLRRELGGGVLRQPLLRGLCEAPGPSRPPAVPGRGGGQPAEGHG